MAGLASQLTQGTVRPLFTPPDEQVTRVREWNELDWGFTEEDFEKLGPAPTVPDEPLVAVVLVPYLPDLPKKGEKNGSAGYIRTFRELQEIAGWSQGMGWCWNGYWDNKGRLKLLDGIEHAPGLRWEVLDLGANRGRAPKDVRDPKTSPHAGVLAAAALHPKWLGAMDGDQVPNILVPGYQVDVHEVARWAHVPSLVCETRILCLSCKRSDRRVFLNAAPDGACIACGDGWAVPTFRGEIAS